jgi:hypothetical protein
LKALNEHLQANISTGNVKYSVLLGLCTALTHKPGMSFNRKLAALVFQTIIYNAQETPIKTISINYDLLPKSSPDMCFNKLITNLRMPMLIICD